MWIVLTELLINTEVIWLTKGTVLKHVYENLKEDLEEVIHQKDKM